MCLRGRDDLGFSQYLESRFFISPSAAGFAERFYSRRKGPGKNYMFRALLALDGLFRGRWRGGFGCLSLVPMCHVIRSDFEGVLQGENSGTVSAIDL